MKIQISVQISVIALSLLPFVGCTQKSNSMAGILGGSSTNGSSSVSGPSGGPTPAPTTSPIQTPNPTPAPTTSPPPTQSPTPTLPGQPPILPSTIKTALTAVPPTIINSGHQNDLLVYSGYLDVTLYGADPTGTKDSTSAIQQAINDAMAYDMAAYIPCPPQTPCTYKVSKTLTGTETLGNVGCMSSTNIGTFYPYGGPQAPSLVGPASGPRPTIVLADNSSGFNNSSSPQPVLHFVNNGLMPNGQLGAEYANGVDSRVGASDCLFYSVIRDLNFSLGNGNSGAVAIQFYTAQYSYMENVMVNATNSYAGIQGIPGTGVWTNLEVNGGQYGVMFDGGGGAMAIAGLTLENQQTAGFFAAGDTAASVGPVGASVISGFNIQETSGTGATGVYAGWSWGPQTSSVSLIDGSITVAGNNPAINNTMGAGLYLNNVYLKASSQVLVQNSGQKSVSASSGNTAWIQQYAHVDTGTGPSGSPQTSYDVVNGVENQTDTLSIQNGIASVPTDLVIRHLPGQLPWITDSGVVYATAVADSQGHFADPTGNIDSTAAIQAAINASSNNGSNEVFLPRGDYVISGTLNLGANTRFFGVPGSRTRIFAPNWNPTVTNPSNPYQPLISTANSATGTLYMGDIFIDLDSYPSGHADPIYGDNATYLNAINWQTGRSSVMNQVNPQLEWVQGPDFTSQARKIVHVMNNGGGRFYGLDEQFLNVGGSRQSNAGFRLLLVDSTQAPLTLYGANPEHNSSIFFEISNASNVRFLGMKTENDGMLVSMSGANNIMLTGLNGDYRTGSSEISMTSSTNVSLSCIGYYAYGVSNASLNLISNGSSNYSGADGYDLFQVGSFNPYCGTSGFAPCTGTQQSFPYCGDSICDGGETPLSCPADCVIFQGT